MRISPSLAVEQPVACLECGLFDAEDPGRCSRRGCTSERTRGTGRRERKNRCSLKRAKVLLDRSDFFGDNALQVRLEVRQERLGDQLADHGYLSTS